METSGLKLALRRGWWVFLALLVLTAVEYLVLLVMPAGNLIYMIIMNLVDAALILYFFMHIGHLWQKESH